MWNTCGSTCTRTCANPSPDCRDVCIDKCECPDHKPFLQGDVCIHGSQCPGLHPCSGGLMHTGCVSACQKTCADPNPNCEVSCLGGGCQCPPSAPLLHNGGCIAATSCCSSEEEWTSCGSGCTKTCENPNPSCAEGCVERCQCPSETPILHQGHCIAKEDCCVGDQTWNTCASSCIKTCDDPVPTCNDEDCVARCDCPVDRPVLHEGNCITKESCCTGGHVWNDCASACTKTCMDKDPVCTEPCVPRCECPASLPIFNSGECIVEEKCCPGEQVWTECGSACDKTCNDPNPSCTGGCVERCQCPDDKPILHDGRCIQEANCCPGEQVWKNCAAPCTRTCDNFTPLECVLPCEPRCECPKDKPYLENGVCKNIPECCSGGKVYETCVEDSTPTCDTNPQPQSRCVNRCICPPDIPIWHNNKCMKRRDCKHCSGGKVWNECYSFCIKTCDNPDPECPQFIACTGDCECPDEKPILHNMECIKLTDCPDDT